MENDLRHSSENIAPYTGCPQHWEDANTVWVWRWWPGLDALPCWCGNLIQKWQLSSCRSGLIPDHGEKERNEESPQQDRCLVFAISSPDRAIWTRRHCTSLSPTCTICFVIVQRRTKPNISPNARLSFPLILLVMKAKLNKQHITAGHGALKPPADTFSTADG